MKASAQLKKLHIAPRKIRCVVDLIRSRSVEDALNRLPFVNKVAAEPIRKLLLSVKSNWVNKNPDKEAEVDNLHIKKIYVNSAGMLKRNRPTAKGISHLIRKRMGHVKVEVDLISIDDDKNKQKKNNNKAK